MTTRDSICHTIRYHHENTPTMRKGSFQKEGIGTTIFTFFFQLFFYLKNVILEFNSRVNWSNKNIRSFKELSYSPILLGNFLPLPTLKGNFPFFSSFVYSTLIFSYIYTVLTTVKYSFSKKQITP